MTVNPCTFVHSVSYATKGCETRALVCVGFGGLSEVRWIAVIGAGGFRHRIVGKEVILGALDSILKRKSKPSCQNEGRVEAHWDIATLFYLNGYF